MEPFHQVFKYYIDESEISIVNLNHLTGIDRSTLYQYASGKRLPPSVEVVTKLAFCLQLEKKDADKLNDSYFATRDGEYDYFARKQITRIIFSNPWDTLERHSLNFSVRIPEDQPRNMILTGRYNIEHAIEAVLLSDEAENEIFLSTIVLNDYIAGRLYALLKKYPDKKIRHLLMLDNKKKLIKGQALYNLTILEKLYPLMTAGSNYECRYSYGDVDTCDSSIFPMYNIIFTKNCLMFLQSDLEGGLLSFGVDTTEPLQGKLEQSFLEASVFNRLHTISDAVSLPLYNEHADARSTKGNETYFFDGDFCIASIFDPQKDQDLLSLWGNETAAPNVQEVQDYIELCRKLYRMKSGNPEVHTIFTRPGIEWFCRTGQVSGLRITRKYPLSVSKRIAILERWIQVVEKEQCHMISFDKNYHGSCLGIGVNHQMVLMESTESEQLLDSLVLEEPSIVMNIFDCLKHYYVHECLPQNETLEFLKGKVEEMKNLTE